MNYGVKGKDIKVHKEHGTLFRIYNKSKDGVKIFHPENDDFKISWKEFNETFEIVDNIWAKLKPSIIQQEWKDIIDFFDEELKRDPMLLTLTTKGEKNNDPEFSLQQSYRLGVMSKKYLEKFPEHSLMDYTKNLKMYLEAWHHRLEQNLFEEF